MCLHENHKEGFQTEREKKRDAILIISLKIECIDLFKLY